MNKIFQRTYQRTQRTLFKPIFTNVAKHYQAQLMRQPIQQPIIIFMQEPIVIPEPVVIQETKAQRIFNKDWAGIEARAAADARKLCEYLENRTLPIEKKPIMTPNGIRTEPLVIPGAPEGEWDYVEAQTAANARKLCEYLENRPPLVKKPIMTPNGIRTEPLVIPGPAHNDFIFEKQQADRSLALMNESFRRQGRFVNTNTHEKEFF